MKLAAGTTLQDGKYLLNYALSRKAFSLTYLSQDLLNNGAVIKTVNPRLKQDTRFPQLARQFMQVSRQVASCQHPSLVKVSNFFEEGGLPFMVTEYVPGQTLAERVHNTGALPKEEAIHYVRQIASALSVAHRQGLCHGNLEPQNLICKQGTNLVVIVGFGINHELAQLSPAAKSEYGAPERANVPHPTVAIDIYALAGILAYLLTGHPLTPQQVPQVSLGGRRTLEQAIFQGLAKDPLLRSATIADWFNLIPGDSLPLPVAAPTVPTAAGGTVALANSDQIDHQPPGMEPAVFPTPVPSDTDPQSEAVIATSPVAKILAQLRRLPTTVVLLSTVATVIGFSFGLALRLSATRGPGSTFLHPDQLFPEKMWKGTESPTMKQSDIPTEGTNAFPPGVYNVPEPPLPQEQYSPPAAPPPAPAPVEDKQQAAPAPRVAPSAVPTPTPAESINDAPAPPSPAVPVPPADPVTPAAPPAPKPASDSKAVPDTVPN